MARIKYASIVSSVSGSIGSATFQKSLYGDILRNKPRPRRSSTAAQLSCRAIMMRVHAAWSALTAAQRTQWNQFIAFANATIHRDRSVLQTGHSYFIKYNYFRLLTGQAIQSIPLYTLLNVGIPTINFGWNDEGNSWDLQLSATAPGVDLWFVFKISSKIPENIVFKRAGLRYMDITVAASTTFEMMTLFKNAFGYYAQTGDWMAYEIQYFGITNTMISGKYTGTKKLF
ncbi:MAG: hypothetical protein Q7J06_01365 [Bacteroidales bacterium]|nr:hypothetical protein [Bacteroidales bacterium]